MIKPSRNANGKRIWTAWASFSLSQLEGSERGQLEVDRGQYDHQPRVFGVSNMAARIREVSIGGGLRVLLPDTLSAILELVRLFQKMLSKRRNNMKLIKSVDAQTCTHSQCVVPRNRALNGHLRQMRELWPRSSMMDTWLKPAE
jgi:hypothetical protein